MNRKGWILLSAVLVVLAFAVAAGTQRAQTEERAEKKAEKREKKAEGRAGKAEKQTGERAEERAEKQRAKSKGRAKGESRGPEEVTLRIEGGSGTEFSGTCTVGDEEHDLSGEVPQSFDYSLDGQKLECGIQKQDAGRMKVVLTGDGINSIQQVNGSGGTTVNLAYDAAGGVSFSTSSGSANQTSSSSSVSSSSIVSSSSSTNSR